MAAPTNHFKLGLFVIAAFVAAVRAMVVLGAQHHDDGAIGIGG